MEEALHLFCILLASLGTLLVLVSAIGVLRLPDLLTRMHASSKAATLGAILIFLAIALRAGDVGVIVRVIFVCAFLLITAPVAAHAIARAGYRSGVPLPDSTELDELREHLNEETGEGAGGVSATEAPERFALHPVTGKGRPGRTPIMPDRSRFCELPGQQRCRNARRRSCRHYSRSEMSNCSTYQNISATDAKSESAAAT
jgi:multicomponent Na+:H+ antiporter subunit G